MRWQMSAFGGKADSDQPLLANLDLGVHALVHLRTRAHSRGMARTRRGTRQMGTCVRPLRCDCRYVPRRLGMGATKSTSKPGVKLNTWSQSPGSWSWPFTLRRILRPADGCFRVERP